MAAGGPAPGRPAKVPSGDRAPRPIDAGWRGCEPATGQPGKQVGRSGKQIGGPVEVALPEPVRSRRRIAQVRRFVGHEGRSSRRPPGRLIRVVPGPEREAEPDVEVAIDTDFSSSGPGDPDAASATRSRAGREPVEGHPRPRPARAPSARWPRSAATEPKTPRRRSRCRRAGRKRGQGVTRPNSTDVSARITTAPGPGRSPTLMAAA